MKKEIIIECIIALLVILFLYASFSKIADLQAFKHAMRIQPFPHWFTGVLVWTIPPLEILVAVALTFGKTRLKGLYVFITLMSVFTLYISAILLRLFHRVPCSCGGIIQRLGWDQHFILNVFFIALACIAVVLIKQKARQPVISTQSLKNVIIH